MAGKESFVFSFVDVQGEPVKDRANVLIRHNILSNFANKSNHDTRNEGDRLP